MSSKVCDTKDLLRSPYRELAAEYIDLSNDGTKDWRANNHVFRAWEYTYVYDQLALQGNERICDIGSENSIFPIWLKLRYPDLDIVCVDPVMDGRLSARADFHGVNLDIREQPFGLDLGQFDRITCISVMEHVSDQFDIQLMKRMAAGLCSGGVLALTVDYDKKDEPWPTRTRNVTEGCRMYGPEQIRSRIIDPSGLSLRVSDENAGFTYRALFNEVPGIDPMYLDYTSICLVLEK